MRSSVRRYPYMEDREGLYPDDVDGDGNTMLSYSYTIGGVDYQAFQRLDAEQLLRPNDYLPGSNVALRYDPRRPANSFVV